MSQMHYLKVALCLTIHVTMQFSTPISSASPATPAPPGKKKLTVWKRFKNVFTPGKSKSEEQKDAAQRLMQNGQHDNDTHRFSEKHSQQAQRADSIAHYSRTTSFRDAQENHPPTSYRYISIVHTNFAG